MDRYKEWVITGNRQTDQLTEQFQEMSLIMRGLIVKRAVAGAARKTKSRQGQPVAMFAEAA